LRKEYFNNIDELPIWNWWKVAETSNLIYLQKNVDYTKEDYTIKAFNLWNDLQNQYLNEFGITEEFRQILALKKRWIAKKSDYIITGNRFNLTEIDIIEAEISETMNDKIKVDKEDTIIVLEQKLSFPLDEKKLSVKKYYNYINHFSKNK
jgi:predicted Mrr-cat superfamily restriction endonuclease